MDLSLRAYGERGWLLHASEGMDLRVLRSALEHAPPIGLEDFVCGYANVLLYFEKPVLRQHVLEWLTAVRKHDLPELKSRLVGIPVVYDGPDLQTVADRVGLEQEAVVRIHSEADYVVRMMGFAPGFPYLDGLDSRLYIDRKESPRDRIEPGSVAIGGSHAGIYSVASPGGWHILGRTEVTLFRPEAARGKACDANEVFALKVGDRVKFIPVT